MTAIKEMFTQLRGAYDSGHLNGFVAGMMFWASLNSAFKGNDVPAFVCLAAFAVHVISAKIKWENRKWNPW